MKRSRRLFCALLALLLGLSLCPAALAEGDTVTVSEAEDLFALSERCSYDAWSRGKTVILTRDLNLGGVEFPPIPSFGGTFEGMGHTVSGLSVTGSALPAGLFGTVAESGVVRDLTVEGTVAPGQGDRSGGVAGLNRGQIVNCAFTGTVSGGRRTGGVAGENAVTGILRSCTAAGGVTGWSMTGGVVGANRGSVLSCVNNAYVNTVASDPTLSVDRLDLSLTTGVDGLVSADTLNIIEDCGGVAGWSDALLSGCRNLGTVGYRHMGYNVGGVVGRSSGHVAQCVNKGTVFGRREVGGVVGAAEPEITMDLRESSLAQARDRLYTLRDAVDRALRDAQGASDTLSARLSAMSGAVGDATDRAEELTDRLTDYADSTVREIDRGSEVADALLPMLSETVEGMTEAADAFTGAGAALRDAMDRLDGGASDDLRRAADAFRDAADEVSRGVSDVQSGLRAIERAVGPADSYTGSREQWQRDVEGEKGLGAVRGGLRDSAAALGDAAAALSKLRQDLEALPAVPERGTVSEAERLLAMAERGRAAADLIRGSKAIDALAAAGAGASRALAGLNYIESISKYDSAAARSGMETLRRGVSELAGTDGKNGPFRRLADGLSELAEALKTAEGMSGDLSDAIGRFSDAGGSLSSALRSLNRSLDYLAEQEQLKLATLGEQTDAAADALYDSLRGMTAQMELLNRESKSSSDVLLADVRLIERQLTALTDALIGAVEDAEDTAASDFIEDVSDEEADSIVNGKVLLCVNRGDVSGDIDVGGVAGSMMVYNETDPENDTDGLASLLRRRYELRCVLQDCVNRGAVSGKRDNVGAVCGMEALGLIRGCEAYGSARSDGDCVGGIAGFADGAVRRCWARCSLSGGEYVGGVVGGGREERSRLTLENCRALVEIENDGPYRGSILGREAGTVRDNLFVSDTLAGINRVSETGKADPVTYARLLEEPELPAEFRRFTLRFVADGTTVGQETFAYGDSLSADVFPPIPEREGRHARWDRDTLEDLRFDTTVTALYEDSVTALGCESSRSAGRSVFFVQGDFSRGDALDAAPAVLDFAPGTDGLPDRLRASRRTLLEQWRLTVPDDGLSVHTLRYLPPEGVSDRLELYCLSSGGWTRLETAAAGSYLCFDAPGGTVELSVVSAATPWWVWTTAALFLAAAIALAVLWPRWRNRRRTPAPASGAETADGETPPAQSAEERKTARRRTLRRVLLASAAALALTAGAVALLSPRLTDGMGLYALLRGYAEDAGHDMELSFSGTLNGRVFEGRADLFTTNVGDKRVGCMLWRDVPLYYCDGVMLLENGKAYRTDGALPNYAELLSHAAALYRRAEVTKEEANGVVTYRAVADGELADRLLAPLLPDAAALAGDAESVTVELVVTDGEPSDLRLHWDGANGNADAAIRLSAAERLHSLPQAVSLAVSSGEYARAEDMSPALRELLMAWVQLSVRDPLTAALDLSADAGPLTVKDALTWQRAERAGRDLCVLTRQGSRLYYTDDAACTGAGTAADRGEKSLDAAPHLLKLAYLAFLQGELRCEDTAVGRRCTLDLDAGTLADFAAEIAPETRSLALRFDGGSLTLELEEGAIASFAVRGVGSVRVVQSDVPASISARVRFEREAAFPDLPSAVLRALDLTEKHS